MDFYTGRNLLWGGKIWAEFFRAEINMGGLFWAEFIMGAIFRAELNLGGIYLGRNSARAEFSGRNFMCGIILAEFYGNRSCFVINQHSLN